MMVLRHVWTLKGELGKPNEAVGIIVLHILSLLLDRVIIDCELASIPAD